MARDNHPKASTLRPSIRKASILRVNTPNTPISPPRKADTGRINMAVIASNVGSNETSPGCPPGYVLRDGAAPLYVAPAYAYAAPGWYNPWVFYGGAWVFRPYPYHAYYYHAYYRGGYRGYHR